MKIHIDSEYKCHATDPDNIYRAFDVEFFNLKCPEFIEGYRYIPMNESWTNQNGVTFTGEMISPWKPWSELDAAQYQYEQKLTMEYSKAFSEIERLIKPARVSGTRDTIVEARKQAILTRINELMESL